MSNDNGTAMLCFRPDPRLISRLEEWKRLYSERECLPLKSVSNQFALHRLLGLALDAEGVTNASDQ